MAVHADGDVGQVLRRGNEVFAIRSAVRPVAIGFGGQVDDGGYPLIFLAHRAVRQELEPTQCAMSVVPDTADMGRGAAIPLLHFGRRFRCVFGASRT